VVLLAGTANRPLGRAIARELGTPLGRCEIEHFPDGEVAVRLEAPLRRKEVFIVQPTSPPVNEHLVELLALADACRRAAAERITAVVPYFGYARADARHGRAEPVSARMAADILEAVGINHVITVDPHAPQLEGFFRVPVDSLTAVPVLCDALRNRVLKGAVTDLVVVSPDAGRVRMATEYAHTLGMPGTSVVVLHKRRESGTETEVTHVVGEVRGRMCLVIDDMISTGGTIAESVDALLEAGARPEIIVAATHGLFVRDARDKLDREEIREVLVTDTVAVPEPAQPVHPTEEPAATPVRVVSIAAPIAAAIRQLTAIT
jgi:ribose-phosphate pyrophosphokinase